MHISNVLLVSTISRTHASLALYIPVSVPSQLSGSTYDKRALSCSTDQCAQLHYTRLGGSHEAALVTSTRELANYRWAQGCRLALLKWYAGYSVPLQVEVPWTQSHLCNMNSLLFCFFFPSRSSLLPALLFLLPTSHLFLSFSLSPPFF